MMMMSVEAGRISGGSRSWLTVDLADVPPAHNACVCSFLFRLSASKASSRLPSLRTTGSSSRDVRTEPSKSGTWPQVRTQTRVQTSSQAGPSQPSPVLLAGKLLLVQCVYSPVVRMVTFRNGFVGVSQRGAAVRGSFHCPDHVRKVRAQDRVTSREQNQHPRPGTSLQGFNPAHLDLNLASVLAIKASSSCSLL